MAVLPPLTPAQVARMAGCHRKSVMRAISDGSLPAEKVDASPVRPERGHGRAQRWAIGRAAARAWAEQYRAAHSEPWS